jgi:hypothetical protein
LRPQPQRKSRRRVARTIAAGAATAVGIGHLALLLILSANAPKVASGPQVEPAPADFVVRLERPRPAKPSPQPERRGRPAPPPPLEAARRAAGPPQQATAAPAPAAPVQALPQAAPQTASSEPTYGRWTVAPDATPAQVPALNLAGCTPATLPTLAGAAHEACVRRLTEMAKTTPALPPVGGPRNAREQAYADAVRAWKSSSQMTPHPCPPQDEPAHKLYLDKCSLVNAAGQTSRPFGGGTHPAVKVEFKVRF